MKRIFTGFLTLTCLMALLTGCGSKQTNNTDEPAANDRQQEQKTYTPDEIGENSSIANLLSHHDTLTYVNTFIDENGDADTVVRGQYTKNGEFLQLSAVYEDGSGNATYYRQAYADDTYAGAEYAQTPDGQTYMTLYEDNDSYENSVGAWLVVQPSSESETVTETSMQDDAVLVTTRKEYRDEADLYEINLYYIDPETNDLLYMESTAYSTQDDSAISTVKTEITYDTPVTFAVSPFETITGSSDYCEVNLVVDPQQDDMKVCWYPVAHGTSVYVTAGEGTKVYGDEGLTQELDPLAIDISGAVCNIFVVRTR